MADPRHHTTWMGQIQGIQHTRKHPIRIDRTVRKGVQMAGELNVDPESLHRASGNIQNHGEFMIGVHHESLGESEAAQTGWVGGSAGALSGMLTTWSEVTTDHATRLSNHVTGLHTSATVFSEMDRTNADAIRAVYRQGAQDSAEDL